MKRFQFRLESLLGLRKRKEEEVTQLLGKKNREVMTAQTELNALVQTLKELQSTQKSKRAATLNILELRYAVAYRYKLRDDILKKGTLVQELMGQAETIRRRLVKATQERRAVEIIRERQYSEWKKEYNSREQQFIDDISQQAFIRKAHEAASAA